MSSLRAEIDRHIREKVELAGLVAKERARIERLEAEIEGLRLDQRLLRAALARKESRT